MDECEEKLGAMGGEGGRPALSNQKKNVWNKKMISLMMIFFLNCPSACYRRTTLN